MNRLPSVIGLAPSELSFEAFKEKLSGERNRVRESLEEFRSRRFGSRGRSARPRKPKGIAAVLKASGLSPNDFLKGLEQLKKMERKEKDEDTKS